MPTGIEIIALIAAGTFAASVGVASRLYAHNTATLANHKPSKKTALHVAVARERAVAKRRMVPEKIALCVVEYLRAEGLNAYPIIPEDLDDTINLWCDDAGVARVSTQRVRELIALLPGVDRPRIRLATNHPANRYVRNRMIARGHPVGEKATAYVISDAPQVTPCATPENLGSHPGSHPTSVQPLTHVRPTRGRPRKTPDRTYVSSDDQGWSDGRREAA